MSKKQSAAGTSATTDGMATIVIGDAAAIGENTLSVVDATSLIVEDGNKTKAKGYVSATAVASSTPGETTLASADTDVAVSGADKVVIKTIEESVQIDGISYETSTTKFKAVDHGETWETSVTKVKYREHASDDADVVSEISGNVAVATFDVQAIGDDSLTMVDVFTLAIEDELSQTTVLITSAVG